MRTTKNISLVIVLALALLAQLINPIPARAEGETPPPTDVPTETSTAEPTVAPTKLTPTESPTSDASSTAPVPTATETPVETPSAAPTDSVTVTAEPVETSTPDPTQEGTAVGTESSLPTESATEVLPSEAPTDILTPTIVSTFETKPPTPETPTYTPEPISTPDPSETTIPVDTITTDQATLLETVQTISSDTSVVVLDENGQPVPLVTQDAADIIEQSDPMWCPDGVAPGGPGCTGDFATMVDLLNNAGSYINSQNVNGTIWITSGTVGGVNPAIDGSTYTNWANYSLTLQGGWSGFYGDTSIGANSVFSNSITITNWNNSVTVNNVDAPQISISDSTITNGGRITLSNVGTNIVMSNVHIDHASGAALGITTNGMHNVNITNSSFTNSQYNPGVAYPYADGVEVFPNGGNVTITNSNLSGNDFGLWVVNGNQVSVTDSDFNINNQDLVVDCSTGYVFLNFPDSSITNPFKINVTIQPDYVQPGCVYNSNYSYPSLPPGPTPPPPAPPTVKKGINLRKESYTRNDPIYQGKAEFYLNCANQKNFKINLPNGDKVEIYCPVTGKATITRVDNTTLPAQLPTGFTFASAFEVEILQPDIPIRKDPLTNDYVREPIPVIRGDGHITASFVETPLQAGKSFSILYWDEVTSQWIPLQDFLSGRSFKLFSDDPRDERKIISGVALNTNTVPARVEVSTNFPGIFVLAQR